MSRSLEPTLLSLLPTLPSAASLPPPLLELASSLLAQSRHNASTLKAEEEVARLYACAHIACERLKTSLDLPPIQARPPVPPRIYKRLYTHLDHILPTNSVAQGGRIRTPSGRVREVGGLFGSGSAQRTRERATPTKDASLAQFRSKGNGTPSKSTGKATVSPAKRKAASANSLPPWVRPAIQSVCTQLDGQRVGRTVLAGMQTIIVPQGRRSPDEWVNTHITPLLAAIYFMVSSRVTILESSGEGVRKDQYGAMSREIVQALQQAREEVDVKDEDDEDFWQGWSDVARKDVDEAVKKITENAWKDDEWFTGIDELVANTQGAKDADDDVGMNDSDNGDFDGGKTHMQRGDTLLQGRWVMTERKREEYRIWKDGILKRIEEMEIAGHGGMDVDTSA
jgi:origin recognition complex subunit 6